MAKAYPQEFRDDVVAVARKGQAPLSQIAKDFGISESTLSNWLKRADVEDGHRPGLTEKQSLEVRELKKRNRLLESMYVGLDRRLHRCLLDLAEIYGPDEARPVIPFTQEQLAASSEARDRRPTRCFSDCWPRVSSRSAGAESSSPTAWPLATKAAR